MKYHKKQLVYSYLLKQPQRAVRAVRSFFTRSKTFLQAILALQLLTPRMWSQRDFRSFSGLIRIVLGKMYPVRYGPMRVSNMAYTA